MTGPEHVHRHDTNGDRYRCPVVECWWQATGAQREPSQIAELEKLTRELVERVAALEAQTPDAIRSQRELDEALADNGASGLDTWEDW